MQVQVQIQLKNFKVQLSIRKSIDKFWNISREAEI